MTTSCAIYSTVESLYYLGYFLSNEKSNIHTKEEARIENGFDHKD